MSRQHAMVEFQNGVYFMVDMGSTNGVEFNGQRIARKQIGEGDSFRICDHEMRFTYRWLGALESRCTSRSWGWGRSGQASYGVRLAAFASVGVSFVVRQPRKDAHVGAVRVTRIDGDGQTTEVAAPSLETSVPPGADVLLVCVRVEQARQRVRCSCSPPAAQTSRSSCFTPMLPHDLARLSAKHRAASTCRHASRRGCLRERGGASTATELPKVAPTLVDAAPPIPAGRGAALVRDARQGGLRRAPRGSGSTSRTPATTLSFIPLAMGVDAAGGVDALLSDRGLLRIVLDAVDEGLVLARRVGRTPGWADILTRFHGRADAEGRASASPAAGLRRRSRTWTSTSAGSFMRRT